MELPKAISAILFYQAEPVTVKRLTGLLKRTESDVRDALSALDQALESTGLRLLRNGDEFTLGTKAEAGALIEAITKEELSRDLSRAALETLSIVLYKGPVTRSEIDYVRGVNSTFILRNLLVRGLIERIDNPEDQRSFLYKPTFQLLEYMGVAHVEELPEHEETVLKLAQFVKTKEEEMRPGVEDGKEELFDDATPEEEADIVEEDDAGKNFDDTVLEEHRKEDHLSI
ncbi:MAG TPA: SMC-Scp complex subunit ScpB [Candidatus Paceibacterota bacterium]